ncbi:MAG: alkaline phosphatase family protein [Chloroflexota bacterium]|nr:alkaline phosphatase family protein [Chloroflexota bacterium]
MSADRSLAVRPAYGSRSLAEIVPSILAALGVPGAVASIDLPAARRACLVVVDGLGWPLLKRHREHAQFLAAHLDGALPATTVFPSSTAVSLTSLMTGAPPGRHGITGYTMRVPPLDGVMSCLTWSTYGGLSGGHDLRPRFPPEQVQPIEPLFALAEAGGVMASAVTPAEFAGSGLSIAAYRGARLVPFGPATDDDVQVAAIVQALVADRSFAYTYRAEPDATGHARGVASAEWRAALRRTDRLVEQIARALPPSTLLVVTSDHGMIDVAPGGWTDVAREPALAQDVLAIGGDPRARHVYAEDGAADEVVERWRVGLGDAAVVLSRAEVVDGGLMGESVTPAAAERIGDVVAVPAPGRAIVDGRIAAWEADLIGHHGGLTADEGLVPLLSWLT